MRATSKLRELLGTGKTLFVPGCYNALSARILETVGFPAVYMTGYGTSLSLLGLPDAEARELLCSVAGGVLSELAVDRILADGWDVIVDGADNFPTRYLINDASVFHDPFVLDLGRRGNIPACERAGQLFVEITEMAR